MNSMYNKSQVMVDNAYSNLENAKKSSTLDDAYFDIACYNAQQGIEFILKAVLIECRVQYEKEHDILYLLDLVSKTDFKFEGEEKLKLIATTITSWETQGRYTKGVKTKEDTVRRVLNLYKSIDKAFCLTFGGLSQESETDKTNQENTKSRPNIVFGHHAELDEKPILPSKDDEVQPVQNSPAPTEDEEQKPKTDWNDD